MYLGAVPSCMNWQDHEGRSRVEVSAAKVAFAQLPKPCISGQTRDDDHFLYVG